MAENKTKPTEVPVERFLEQVTPDVRREDGRVLCALMQRISGEPPRMWGPTIVGFGTHHYRYESGREGEICRMGFSPRGGALTLYLPGFDGRDELLSRMGKHKTGKACLYVNKLADVDMAVLEELIARSRAAAPA